MLLLLVWLLAVLFLESTYYLIMTHSLTDKQHPLTDEMIEQIAPTCQWAGDIGDVVFRHGDMRVSADWQLEQVIEWLRSMDQYDYLYIDENSAELNRVALINDLRNAMRPQQQQENKDTP
jgi:hypothetical protein